MVVALDKGEVEQLTPGPSHPEMVLNNEVQWTWVSGGQNTKNCSDMQYIRDL